MYRDADLMDEMPEIGAALDIISEESCNFDSEGKMLHVKSKSKRIKAVPKNLLLIHLLAGNALKRVILHYLSWLDTVANEENAY